MHTLPIFRIDTTGLPPFRCFLPLLIGAPPPTTSSSSSSSPSGSLRYLDLSENSILSDLSRIPNLAVALGQVRVLKLKKTDVTNESIVFAAATGALRHVEHLDLSRVMHLSDSALIAIARGCPRLQNLSISHIKNASLSDASIFEMGTRCASHLAVLDFSHTRGRITDRAIAQRVMTDH